MDTKTKEALDNLKNAILNYDTEEAKKAAQAIVDNGIDAKAAISEGVLGASATLHERFERGECFIPHLVMAGDAMEAAGKILESSIPKEEITAKKVVVIGTVEADLHSVGKNIVAMFFRSGGYEVHDLGVNVKASSFISKAIDTNADIVALSSLLTTTRPYMREVIEEMESVGVRDKFKVIVGGGPITAEWAKEIGADGYGTDAYEGIETAKKLLAM
jgi:methylmalonyl-CoA mutase cobalamin-binding domain/chain